MNRFLPLFLASVLVLALAACGGKTERENSGPVEPFEELKGPNGLLFVPPVAGEKKASKLNAENDYLSSILPASSILATHTGGDAAFRAQMIQITKDVWNEAEFRDWIASILLNRFEIYGDEAAAYIDEACDKSMAAYERMSAG